MKNATKDVIFDLLTFILSAATSALVIWAIASFCGKTETDEIVGMFPAFVFIAACAYVSWVYVLDFIFRLFEKK